MRHAGTTTGPVAQWMRHRPTEPGIAGSSPAGVIVIACNMEMMGAVLLTDTTTVGLEPKRGDPIGLPTRRPDSQI